MPNTNQTLFIVIFSLIAVAIVLLTYVCWLKRMKMSAKRDLLYEQHQLERSQQQQQQQQISANQLQQLKPVLLQQLYDQDIQRQRQMNNYPSEQAPQYTPHNTSNDILVNIHDESERDATIIHTEQPSRQNNHQPQNPFADNV